MSDDTVERLREMADTVKRLRAENQELRAEIARARLGADRPRLESSDD